MEKTKEKKNCIEKLTSKPGGKQMIIGWAIIIAAAGLLIHRALFGIATPDESFYLTIPYRFLKGDAFFINEWHVAQLSGALQCLPVLFFVKVFGSGEGIILFFRLQHTLQLIGCAMQVGCVKVCGDVHFAAFYLGKNRGCYLLNKLIQLIFLCH